MNSLELNMKNNLIQNFFIIGLSQDDILQISEQDSRAKFSIIFTDPTLAQLAPKIISKFPPTSNNYNSIKDEVIIEHCFPTGFSIKTSKSRIPPRPFVFELDNNLYNYVDNNKFLYSKIHFTCLEFYESLDEYQLLKDKIINTYFEESKESTIKIENITKINFSEKYYIPKIICFASLLPFSYELYSILHNIYNIYKSKENLLLERYIEKIIMSLPLPIFNNKDIVLYFNHMNEKNENIFKFKEVNFSAFNTFDYYLNSTYSNSLFDLFNYIHVENVMKIFKYIILEVPILIFSPNIILLSAIMEDLLSLITPFHYIVPHTNILPKKYYGLINNEEKFFFGIVEKYSSKFFFSNKIKLNKNLLIVVDLEDKNELVKEITPQNNDNNCKSIIINNDEHYMQLDSNNQNTDKVDIINIDFPAKLKKYLSQKLNNYLVEVTYNNKNNIIETRYIFNCKIRYIFHKFFVKLMSGYTNYLLKCPNNSNYGVNMIYKSNKDNSMQRYIKKIFNVDEYISNFPKDIQIFYKAFFSTHIFFNFIKGILFPKNEIDSFNHKHFDLLTYLKKNKDVRKKNENFQYVYDRYINFFKYIKKNDIIKISIDDDYSFNKDEIEMLEKNKKNGLIKYTQEINSKDNEIKISYILFPKLLYDNKFFNVPYINQFYRHYLTLPNNKSIKEFSELLVNSEHYYLREYSNVIYPRAIQGNRVPMSLFLFSSGTISDKSSSISFNFRMHSYIEFIWLLLNSCSLWYCNSQEEIDVKVDNIFDILAKVNFVEEQILFYLCMAIYKYSTKQNFIRIMEIIKRFTGFNSYSIYLLLFDKMLQIEKNIDSTKNNNISNINNKRSLLDINLYKKEYKELDDCKLKEEFLFICEKQICDKCGNEIEINLPEIISQKIDKMKNNFVFKCPKCEEKNENIYIEYYLTLNNLKNKDKFIVNKGKFKLIAPHLLFENLKSYVIEGVKNYELDIDHIFSNKNINLLNIIFYFNFKNLPIDFIIPYLNENENRKDRDYFNVIDDIDETIEEINNDTSIIKDFKKSDNTNFSLIPDSGSKNEN